MTQRIQSTLENVASERAVLAGLMQHGQECLVEVEAFVKEDTFTLEQNSIVFRCLTHALRENERVEFTDVLSSARALNLDTYLEKDESVKHLRAIANTPIDIGNVEGHAKRLARLSFARRLQSETREIYLSMNKITGDEPLASILACAEEPIQQICMDFMKEDELSPKSIGEDIDEYLEHLRENQGKSIGIPTGMASFDAAIGGGLRRGGVNLISARPKTGKSVVADNVALHIADNLNIPVLVLDTEMSKQDHWDRMLANISNIPINDIGSGAIYEDPAKVDAVKLAANKLKSIPYDYISISGRPFEEILSIAKRWLLKEVGYDENGKMRDCVIIYDYLKLMSSSSISNNMAEFQVLGFQITQLHDFCVKYDCACLSFVQLNRDGITKESTDAVSGSDRLIWLCTSFTIFKDKTEEEILTDGKQHGNKKLVPIVQRHGPGIEDQGYICLNMEGKFARVSDLGTIRERQKAEEFENADSQEEDVDQNF